MKKYRYTIRDRANGQLRDDYKKSVRARSYDDAVNRVMQAEGVTHCWDISIHPDDQFD